MNDRSSAPIVILLVLCVAALILGLCSFTVIQPGQSGVQVTFGAVNQTPLDAGTHLVNPFSHIAEYDTKQQTWKEESVPMPSGDQLITTFDISVQYSIIPSATPKILQETGNEQQLISVQLEPELRSLLREVSKSVPQASDFFQEPVQTRLQAEVLEKLSVFCTPKGLNVEAVLFRNIVLPDVITKAVQAKVTREQMVKQQDFELQRFQTQEQQKVATATAEEQAAEQKAKQTRIEADAQAYQIKMINDAASTNPVYVQLQALKTLSDMSKDPATKLYFMDGQSRTPLPLLHLSDAAVAAASSATGPEAKAP